MNYRHAYHAGNFADVFKHIILTALIQSLSRKENPFCFIDTHAGAGMYDLESEAALKNKEHEQGILKLLHEKNPPKLVQHYLTCVQTLDKRFYPGSPKIARYFLRSQDRMILCELHPEEHQLLKTTFARDAKVSVHLLDGYHGLKAFLPPKERRGLILIDPPYEKPNELITLITDLSNAIKRFETGVFALWYPIKTQEAIRRFHQELNEKIKRPMLMTELSIYPEDNPTQLNGSGMIIVNPPWKLDQEIQDLLPWLWKQLSVHHQGRHEVKWLS